MSDKRTKPLSTPKQVRKFMKAEQRTQHAFVTRDGEHVLVQIDPRHGIGIVDPNSLRSWRRLSKIDDWPLTPLLSD